MLLKILLQFFWRELAFVVICIAYAYAYYAYYAYMHAYYAYAYYAYFRRSTLIYLERFVLRKFAFVLSFKVLFLTYVGILK